MRTHPAIIAQAAATAACLMPGRFFLGVGAGENLNEHITGDKWPTPEVRLEMLAEAVHVIRQLWEAGSHTHRGQYYTVEDARIYDLPEALPDIIMAAGGETSARLAAEIAEGLIATSASTDLVEQFRGGSTRDRPCYGKLSVCWAESESKARQVAHEYWPTSALEGINWELRLPEDFEKATKHVTEDQVANEIVCGPDAALHIERIEEFFDAGFDRVYVSQAGPDQEGFFRFYEREVIPTFVPRKLAAPVG
jgi:G6PDH family F420-dependent oxidoreductase